MTDPQPNDDSKERWLRDVLDGRRLPPPEEPEEPPTPSFHGGPRTTALVEPTASAVMNAEIRRAAAGLPPERRPEPGSTHR